MKKLSLVVMVLAVGLLVAAAPASAVNSLVVNAGAALNATNFGLAVTVGPNAGDTNAVYVQSSHPTDETHMEIRFRLRDLALNAPLSGAGRNFRFLNMADDAFAATPHKILFLQRQATTGNWRLAAWTYTNSNVYEFAGGFFFSGYHNAGDFQIRCEWTKATAPNNGIFHCERTDNPGTFVFTRSDIHESYFQPDFVQAGFLDFDSVGAATGGGGKLDFDEYESYR